MIAIRSVAFLLEIACNDEFVYLLFKTDWYRASQSITYGKL